MRNYIETLRQLAKKYIDIDKILNNYTKLLRFLTEMCNITFHYTYKIYEAQAKIPTPSITSILTFLFRLGIYSQLIAMFGVILPFPESLLVFAKTVINDYTRGYQFIRTTVKDTFLTLKENFSDISNLRHENNSIKKLVDK